MIDCDKSFILSLSNYDWLIKSYRYSFYTFSHFFHHNTIGQLVILKTCFFLRLCKMISKTFAASFFADRKSFIRNNSCFENIFIIVCHICYLIVWEKTQLKQSFRFTQQNSHSTVRFIFWFGKHGIILFLNF